MKKIKIISSYSKNSNDAGKKAKKDIEDILLKEFDIEKLYYERIDKLKGFKKLIYKLKKIVYTLKNTISTDILIVQFPYTTSIFMTSFAKHKICFIHDLACLRNFNMKLKNKEIKFINSCEYVIAHNNRMKEFLTENGVNHEKIFVNNIFDYLADGNIKNKKEFNREKLSISFVGNVNKKKTPFLYQLDPKKMNFKLFLCGIGIDSDINDKEIYRGQFKPEELLDNINEDLGLVWGGTFDDSDMFGDDTDSYKRYTKYNNPHKLSCYLAAGIPVVVWEKSAMAEFVKKNNVGYTINNIYDINNLDLSEYNVKKENAINIGNKLREGYYTKQVINQVLNKIEN